MKNMSDALPLSIPTLSRVLDQSPDCVKLLDAEGRLVWMNANGLCAMEIDALTDVSGREWATLWPAEEAANIETSLVKAEQTGTATFKGFCPTAKGSERWWDVTVHPALDRDGKTIGYISISRDTTEREKQRVALEAVVAEMRHRLRNSYAITCGLIRGLTRGDAALSEFSRELQRRIMAISDAQSLFALGNAQTDLGALVSLLVAPFQNQQDLVFDLTIGSDILIDSRVADAIALAVGEFVVNSLKHGAIGKGGALSVMAMIEEDALVLRWQEDARARVAATSREGGQGFRIITQMLAANDAGLELNWGDCGPQAEIRFSKGFAVAADSLDHDA